MNNFCAGIFWQGVIRKVASKMLAYLTCFGWNKRVNLLIRYVLPQWIIISVIFKCAYKLLVILLTSLVCSWAHRLTYTCDIITNQIKKCTKHVFWITSIFWISRNIFVASEAARRYLTVLVDRYIDINMVPVTNIILSLPTSKNGTDV